MKQHFARTFRRIADRLDPRYSLAVDNSWITNISGGLVSSWPSLPNAAGTNARKVVPWWRLLLRRFGR